MSLLWGLPRRTIRFKFGFPTISLSSLSFLTLALPLQTETFQTTSIPLLIWVGYRDKFLVLLPLYGSFEGGSLGKYKINEIQVQLK